MFQEDYLNSSDDLKKRSKITKFDHEYNHSLNAVKEKFEKNPDCIPIFIAVVGSTSYGLDLEGSDIDMKGIYIQNLDSILTELKLGQANPYNYLSQIGGVEKGSKEKKKEDITLYELGRYLEMLQGNNPNILELLNTPEDCIVYEHPFWKEIKSFLLNDKILSKKCYFTFHNYALQQIKKAKGLNKKINNPIAKERKTPMDFCYVIQGHKSIPLLDYLEKNNMEQLFCGIVNVPNSRDTYAIFYDKIAHLCFSKQKINRFRKLNKFFRKLFKMKMGLGYKGILKEAHPLTIYNSDGTSESVKEWSNTLRLSSTPKDQLAVAIMSYNKDGYSTYTSDYKDYWGEDGWLVKRNEERYNDNVKGGQGYDGKNMSHCMRLLYMALEIAKGKGVVTMRDEKDRELLIKIKKGEFSYEKVLSMANEIVYGYDPDSVSQDYDSLNDESNTHESLQEAYDKSSLIQKVDLSYIQESILTLRKKFYDI